MTGDGHRASPPRPVADLLETATGRVHRTDPATGRSGGPAGNARLTSWLGIVLLVLFVVELATLLSLRRLINWHIGLGTVLVPVVLAKTAVTGWRMLRYYTGDPRYVLAGPPPVLLRLLGPLVVITGVAVLGSGLALVPLGGEGSRAALATVAGHGVSALVVHKLSFVAWFVVVGAHTLARTIPALRLAAGHASATVVSGGRGRAVVLALTLCVGAAAGVVVARSAHAWTSAQLVGGGFEHHDHDR